MGGEKYLKINKLKKLQLDLKKKKIYNLNKKNFFKLIYLIYNLNLLPLD